MNKTDKKYHSQITNIFQKTIKKGNNTMTFSKKHLLILFSILFIAFLNGCSDFNSSTSPEFSREYSDAPAKSCVSLTWKDIGNGVFGFKATNYLKGSIDSTFNQYFNDFHLQIVSGGIFLGYAVNSPQGWTGNRTDHTIDLQTNAFPINSLESLLFNISVRFDQGSNEIVFNWQATRNGIVIYGLDGCKLLK